MYCIKCLCLSCREHTTEVLFEQDNEQKSVATLLLDAIIKVFGCIHMLLEDINDQ